MGPKMRRRGFSWLGFGVLVAGGLTGCQRGMRQVAPAEMPTVPVAHPVQREVTDFFDFTGRTEAVHSVNIIPRVTGYLVEMPFKEGSEVKTGGLLFVIDPRPYDAQLDEAKAQVVLYQASLELAKTTLARYQALDKSTPGAVSKQALDQYEAAVVEAQARLDTQKKSLEVYQLNKEFTRIVSPIDGQVSRYYLTLGNLVNQDQTLLTTVVSLEPMYAYFDMDERTLVQIRQAIAEGKIARRGEGQNLPVLMGLENEEGFPHRGVDKLRQQPGQLDHGQHHAAGRVRQPQADGAGDERLWGARPSSRDPPRRGPAPTIRLRVPSYPAHSVRRSGTRLRVTAHGVCRMPSRAAPNLLPSRRPRRPRPGRSPACFRPECSCGSGCRSASPTRRRW